MSNKKEQHSLEADKNVMMTLSALAKVKPVCVIIAIEFSDSTSVCDGLIKYRSANTLIFTLDTSERFGIEIPDRFEALRQYNYIKYLIEQGGGKIKLEP